VLLIMLVHTFQIRGKIRQQHLAVYMKTNVRSCMRIKSNSPKVYCNKNIYKRVVEELKAYIFLILTISK
jgi:hypothetical protein